MILESKTLARAIMRRAKLTGFAHRVRMLWHRADYEDGFADLLLASIHPDDCVWDVGANVGFYVEGYEIEVIRGMHRVLGGVRALFVEVHFEILAKRGMMQAPAALVKNLKRLGFSRIEWPDASHIAALRE